MNEVTTSRFKGAVWFDPTVRNTIVGGAGSLGSFTCFLLARMNFKPFVYDFDKIEEHNLAGQLFGYPHLNYFKVDALMGIIKDFTGMTINTSKDIYSENSYVDKFMFSCFDNMKARKIFFNNWVTHVNNNWISFDKNNVPIFIDTRLNFENMQIFCVTPDRIKAYKKSLFNDDKIPDEVCTLKSTTHISCMAASHAVGFFTNHLANCVSGEDDREVPFRWDYILPMNTVINE